MHGPQDASLFRGTAGPPDAKIVLVGEAYGSEEVSQQQPFCGAAGNLLNYMLKDAGLARRDLLLTNVVNDRPPQNDLFRWFLPHDKNGELWDGLRPSERVLAGLERLYEQIIAHPRRLIIAAGNYPLWALTPHSVPKPGKDSIKVPTGIGNWRGSMTYLRPILNADLPPTPVLPIIHPAAILREWSMRAYTVHDLKTRVKQALVGDWRPAIDPVVLAPPSFTQATNKLREWLFRLDTEHLCLASDIETIRRTFISCIGLADTLHFAMSIPFVNADGSTYWPADQEFEIVQLLGKVLCHPNLTTIGQNYLYDIQYQLDHWGIRPVDLHDTMLFHHLKFPGEPKDLGHLSSLYCRHHWYWKDDSKEWQGKGDLAAHLKYNCMDALRTLEIGQNQMAMLTPLNLHSKWEKEKQKNELALKMMRRGVRINKEKRKQFGKELTSALTRVKGQLEHIIPSEPGKTPWYNSPIQQMQIFYDKLGLEVVRHRKTKRPTINDEAFNTLQKKHPDLTNLFNLISFKRSLAIFKDVYIDSEIDPDDRARCMINTGGTETFRWSTGTNAFDRGMNMQNLSSGDEHLGWDPYSDYPPPNIREMFQCDEGYIMFEGDLEGADAQVVAWEADDDVLKEAFRKRVDVHALNAEMLWGPEFSRLEKDSRPWRQKRQQTKKSVHLTNYGGSDRAIAMAMGWTIHESQTFQRRWFSIHPGIKERIKRTEAGLKHRNSVTNAYGYSRIYFDRPDNCLTQALAWVPQSTVAIACFDGILQLIDRHPQVEPLMSVHDSNLFQIPLDKVPPEGEITKSLTTITPYGDPLTIPWKLKKSTVSWGDCK